MDIHYNHSKKFHFYKFISAKAQAYCGFFMSIIEIYEATRSWFLLIVHFCLQSALKAEMYIFNASLYIKS